MNHKLTISYKGLCDIKARIDDVDEVNSMYYGDDVLKELSLIISNASYLQSLTDEKIMINLTKDFTEKLYWLVGENYL